MKKQIIFGLFSFIVMPVYTLITGANSNVFSVSFSQKATQIQGGYIQLIVWSLVFCAYFAFGVWYILSYSKLKNVAVRLIACLSGVVMIIGNLLPYIPVEYYDMARLHVLLAQFSAFGVGLTLILLPFAFRFQNQIIFRKTLNIVIFLICTAIALSAVFGAASITEIVCVALTCVYLYYFVSSLKRNPP